MTTKKLPNAKMLLTCGVLAGPLYLAVSFIEILTREGFDVTRHSWSVLSNGELGWIHVMNFIATGLLTILGAMGMRKVLKGEKAGTWGPVLLGLYGVGLICAGIFKADPVDGFPPGTPLGYPTSVSTSGILHLLVGMVGFVGLISACFVFTRRFLSLHQKNWAMYSLITGIFFFLSFMGIIVGSGFGKEGVAISILGFTAGVVLAWSWISSLSRYLIKTKL